MTRVEKRINRIDDQSKESQIEEMIPGIHNLNSVGSSPLKRGARHMIMSPKLPNSGNVNSNVIHSS